MTTVQPGEKIILKATFTNGGLAAVPQTPVNVFVKPISGEYGAAINATDEGGGVFTKEINASDTPGLYVAKFTSADGGVETVVFQVSEG